jgi:hypothetical protein
MAGFESQDSILLSSQEEDSFSEPNSKRSSTIAGPLDDFKEFHPSIVHYCQCFTILTGNRHKITSTMTAIQVYMTEGNDYRLLSESEEIFPKELNLDFLLNSDLLLECIKQMIRQLDKLVGIQPMVLIECKTYPRYCNKRISFSLCLNF